MKIVRAADYEEMSRRAAGVIAAQVILNPASVLGLATGGTPVGAYEQLAIWHKNGDLDFSGVTSVNLDEYCGLEGTHPQSYRYFMQKNLFDHVNIPAENTHLPSGTADPAAECARYEALINSLGGIDMQLLGIGHNGHIGFNEPGPAFERDTHAVTLSAETIHANARFFVSADEVPRQALTMGMGAIMKAKRVLLVASGTEKADILDRALNGPITPEVPASILQLHPDLTVVTGGI